MRCAIARREANQKPTLCRSLSCFLPGFPRPAISFRECMDEKGRGGRRALSRKWQQALLLVASVAFVGLLAFAAFAALLLRSGRSGFRRLLLEGRHVACGRNRLRSGGEGSLDPDTGSRGGGGGLLFLGDRRLRDLRRSDGRILVATQGKLH